MRAPPLVCPRRKSARAVRLLPGGSGLGLPGRRSGCAAWARGRGDDCTCTACGWNEYDQGD